MSFLSDTMDFIMLNLLALVCALPLLTAGASFTALFGVMSAYVLDGSPIRARDFFRRFKDVFLRATLCWIALLIIAVVFLLDVRIAASMAPALRVAVVGGLTFFLLCGLLCSVFLFPMLPFGKDVPLPRLIRNAFIVAIAKLPRTLLMLLLQMLPALVLFLSLRVFITISPVWLTIWFSLCAFLCAKIGGQWYHPSSPKNSLLNKQNHE